MALLIGLLFVFALNAQSNPVDLVCENVVISTRQWEQKFPTTYAFNGFFHANGTLRFLQPDGSLMFAINLDNSVWHQYHDVAGHLIGDLFLSGAFFGFPGVLVLTSRQISNPMLGNGGICQNFIEPSPANLINSYSVLQSHGVGYMESKYFSLEEATLRQVFSNEFFSFDSEFATAFSETNTYAMGNGLAGHFIMQAVNFRYSRITETDALALGWNGNLASVPASSRGFHLGRGAVPVSILNAEQRVRLGL